MNNDELKAYISNRIKFLQKEMDDLEKIMSGTAPDTPEYEKHRAQRDNYRKEMSDWIDTLSKLGTEEKKLELEQQKVDNDRNFKNGQLKNEKKGIILKVAASVAQTGIIAGFAGWMADYETNKERLVRSQPVQTMMKYLKIDKII